MKFPKFKTNSRTILKLDYGSLTAEEAQRIGGVLRGTQADFWFQRKTTFETEKGTVLFGGISLIMDRNSYQVMFREEK